MVQLEVIYNYKETNHDIKIFDILLMLVVEHGKLYFIIIILYYIIVRSSCKMNKRTGQRLRAAAVGRMQLYV